MKFRCERDVLVEALGTAGRAAASRGSVAAGAVRGPGRAHRRPACASPAPTSSSRSRSRSACRASGDGVAVLPGRLASDIVRALAGGACRGRGRRREARISRRPLRVQPADAPRRRVPAPRRAERATPVTLDGAELAAALRQVVPAALERRRPPDPHRRAPRRRGRRPAAGGHRLVPPRRPRPARHHGARRGPARAGARRGRSRSSRGCCAGAEELTLRLGEREASFEVGGTRLTTVLIEGEFPQLPAASSRRPSPTGSPSAARRCSRRCGA